MYVFHDLLIPLLGLYMCVCMKTLEHICSYLNNVCLHPTFIHSIHLPPSSYLNQSVLWPEPGVVRGRPWVQGADVLSRLGSITVEVEAVARVSPHQVAETWGELGRVDLEP